MGIQGNTVDFLLVCEDCYEAGEDVEVMYCPYEEELYCPYTSRPVPIVSLCPACAEERYADT